MARIVWIDTGAHTDIGTPLVWGDAGAHSALPIGLVFDESHASAISSAKGELTVLFSGTSLSSRAKATSRARAAPTVTINLAGRITAKSRAHALDADPVSLAAKAGARSIAHASAILVTHISLAGKAG